MKNKLHAMYLLFLIVLPLKVFAAAGELTSPSLALPAEFPAALRTNIIAALTHADYKFIGGEFVNATTQLWYGGDTKALNLFLKQLSKCDGVVVSISFVQGIDVDSEATWQVNHSGWGAPNRLHVQINLNSKKIHLPDLELPDIK